MKETNMEHYRGDIEAVEHRPALIDGKIKSCVGSCCKDCSFYTSTFENCSGARISWLMSEYKPEPVLTAREKHFVECVDGGYIARTEEGLLRWSEDKPEKQDERGRWLVDFELENVTLPSKLFPFITWEDEEPWSVERLRELKVKENE